MIDISTDGRGIVFFLMIIFALVALWVIIRPDAAWHVERALVSWQYREGDRIELSPAGRRFVRLSGAALLALALGMAASEIKWTADSTVETEGAGRGTVFYVGDPVDAPGCTVRIIACLKTDHVFPIQLTGYDGLESIDGASSDIRRLDLLPPETNLLLFVDERFFPTHLVVSETSDQVTVSVYGKCKPRRSSDPAYGTSAADCSDSGLPVAGYGIVPVTLEIGPPGDRPVLDGNLGTPVEAAG